MSRLPTPGGDSGQWGAILNDYLLQSHKPDGTLKDSSVTENALAPGAISVREIKDGAVTESKLSTLIQTKLNEAHSRPTLSGTGSATTAAKSDHTHTTSDIMDITTTLDTITDAAATATTARDTTLGYRDETQTFRNDAQAARDEAITPVDSLKSLSGTLTLGASVQSPVWLRRTITANSTIIFAAGASGKAYTVALELAQNAIGGYTIDFTGVSWSYGLPPVITGSPNAKDILYFTWTGSQWIGSIGAQAVA